MSSETFNLLEGTFWLCTGMTLLISWRFMPFRYRNLALYSSLILILFGLSDFVQVRFGSFLVPGMEWLLFWKVTNVIAITIAVLWYLRIRLT